MLWPGGWMIITVYVYRCPVHGEVRRTERIQPDERCVESRAAEERCRERLFFERIENITRTEADQATSEADPGGDRR
jgi:hypothetical protein